MRNPYRGVVPFAGDIALHCTTNAMCAIEDEVGQPFTVFARGLNTEHFTRDVRLFVQALASRPLTPEEAGHLIDQVGHQATLAAVVDAINAALPTPDKADGEGGDGATADPT